MTEILAAVACSYLIIASAIFYKSYNPTPPTMPRAEWCVLSLIDALIWPWWLPRYMNEARHDADR